MHTPTASPRTAPPTTPPAESSVPGDGSAGEPTTTAPPQRPTPDDIPLLTFAETFELTVRDLYHAAIDSGLGSDATTTLFQTLRDSHQEYANVLAGLLGVDAARRRDDALYDERVGDFEQGDGEAAAAAAIELEATAVATHTDLIGKLVGIDGAEALAAIAVVEARFGTVLAHVAGNGGDLDQLLAADGESLATEGTEG